MAQGPTFTNGAWEPAFDHVPNPPNGDPMQTCGGIGWPTTFNAVHASLVPWGARRGWIMVWDHEHNTYSGPPAGQTRYVRWALLDPTQPPGPSNPENFCTALPTGKGDLFCAGHAWMADGTLLVAGGTGCHGPEPLPSPCAGWEGSVLVYQWIPPDAANMPPGGTWKQILPDLDQPRWYPSVLAMGPDHRNNDDDAMMIAGGTHDTGSGFPLSNIQSYQVWLPGTTGLATPAWEANPNARFGLLRTFEGPDTASGVTYFGNYPRFHLVSTLSSTSPNPHTGRAMYAGMSKQSDLVDHYVQPGWYDPTLQAIVGWQNLATWQQLTYKDYNSSVLLPIFLAGDQYNDRILSTGGKSGSSPPPPLPAKKPIDLVERTDANAASPTWQAGSPGPDDMGIKRWCHNSVLLPDTTVIVHGGESEYAELNCSEVPALTPQIYDNSQPNGQQWRTMKADDIVRFYHSIALLLPDGRAFTGAGDYRHKAALGLGNCTLTSNPAATVFPADYRIFQPPYVACGYPRPEILSTGGTGAMGEDYAYGGQYNVTYTGLPDGVTVQRVVLMRPGSITHHSDGNQRCVELTFQHVGGPAVRVTVPARDDGILPRGFYMLFVVSSQTVVTQGVPSVAAWVKVQ